MEKRQGSLEKLEVNLKLGILILNYHGLKETLQCVDKLIGRYSFDLEIIVNENGSGDDSFARLAEGFSSRFGAPSHSESELMQWPIPVDNTRISLINTLVNRGFAGGMNKAFRHAQTLGCNAVLLLNNDAWPLDSALETHMALLKKYPRDIISGITLDGLGKVSYSGVKWPQMLFGMGRQLPTQEAVWETGYAEGSALLAPMSIANQVAEIYGSLLDENLFLYCEDVDFSLRVRKLGGGVKIAGNAKYFHAGSVSGGGTGNRVAYYYITRNRVHLVREWLPAGLKFLFHLWYVPSRLAILALTGWRRRKEVNRAVIRGLIDGYSGRVGSWQG